MTIQPGTRLGPYEIAASIGAGGMGEVWRARDTRLDRDVAIKVLPPGFAENEQLLQRFEREAKAISQLNHPHVCMLFDVGEERLEGRGARDEDRGPRNEDLSSRAPAGDPLHEGDSSRSARNDMSSPSSLDPRSSPLLHYLVMELLEGESLADRVKKGPLPLHEVLKYGQQIASALDAAHRQGITHRDLKPGNVMLTKSGAKLLDFGLAKTATEGKAAIDGLTNMPTEAKPLTTEGTILGTFQYMAPEQLEGLEADARTDIFALGAVIYEMATGHRAFQGGSKTSLIAAIVSSQPTPISSVVAMAPPALDHVVRKCLEKDPDDRWQSAHDVASELLWISEAGSQAGVATRVTVRRKTRERLAWTIAAIAVVALAVLSFLQFRPKPIADVHPTVTSIVPPTGSKFDFKEAESGSLTISPNGRHLAFTALEEDGTRLLWIRTLDDPKAKRLSGTNGALYPFWSPDSRFVAFFADSKLKKVDISGAPPITLCDAPDGRSGTWSEKGVILFSPTYTNPIHRVSDTGGKSVPATKLDKKIGETTHRWASFLPDGVHFIYMAGTHTLGTQSESNAILVGSLESVEERTPLFHARSNVAYSAGYLIYVRDGVLLAQPFDPDKRVMTGGPLAIAEGVRYAGAYFRGTFSVSNDRTLVYQTGSTDSRSQLVWFDRKGAETGKVGDPAQYQEIRFAPDGKHMAWTIADEATGTTDIWTYDLERNVPTRLTFGALNEGSPVWSPDGNRIAYCAIEEASNPSNGHVFVTSSNGSSEPRSLFVSKDQYVTLTDWSPDGKLLGLTQYTDLNDGKMRLLHTENEGDPVDFLVSQFSNFGPSFSPDGRWAGYLSNESGVYEGYLVPFPGPGGKWQITNGGVMLARSRWRKNEMIYLTPGGKVWSVRVSPSGNSIRLSTPELLFQNARIQAFDVTPDGQRFLAAIRSGDDPDTPLTIVQNWDAGLKR